MGEGRKICNPFQRMLSLLGMLCLFASCVATGVITATLTALEDEFGIKPTLLAVIVVMYDTAYLVTSLPTAHYLYRDMPKAIGGGMILFGLAAVFYGLGNVFGMFLVGQFLMGVGATPLWVLSFVHIDDNVDDKHKVPKFVGSILSKTPVGVVIGLLLGGVFLSDCEEEEDGCKAHAVTPTVSMTLKPPEELSCEGWKYPFYITGGIAFVLGVIFFFSKKRYADYRAEGDENTEEEDKPDQMPMMKVLKKLLSNRQLVLLLLAQGFITFVGSAVIAFAPRFFEKILCEKKNTANFYTAIFIPFVVAAYAGGGAILDKTKWDVKGQWRMLAVSQALGVPFFLGFYSEETWLFVLLLVVPCFLLFLPNAATLSIAKRIVPAELRPHSMALINMSSRLIGAIPGPIILGVLIDSDIMNDRSAYVTVSFFGSGLATIFSFCGWYLSDEGGSDVESQPVDIEVKEVVVAPSDVQVTTSEPGTSPFRD
eukprot:TRINITY_DN4978_c7_g1_i1.p1 TRINITY_DN4978_c7_g1~~TRINITY_DN4978_c7_g1_i1.p1  ORF type:complete len:489 (+),score=72.34 TRINITY_DN4978_c7_g1_i1:23-1468(+)